MCDAGKPLAPNWTGCAQKRFALKARKSIAAP
jgi:hypothetical protein